MVERSSTTGQRRREKRPTLKGSQPGKARCDPSGRRRERFFGLKGRFRQPRPKAWEESRRECRGPERAVHGTPRHGEWPFQGQIALLTEIPGLRPRLTESALQDEEHSTKSFMALPSGVNKAATDVRQRVLWA